MSPNIPKSDEEWAKHLISAHRAMPNMTPIVFADYRTAEGLNSYEVLAQVLDSREGKNLAVLDLACGDGFLAGVCLNRLGPGSTWLGVDMADSEIERARRKWTDPRAQFACEKAQKLAIASESLDFVLCHLAFMLMLPVGPVVAEIQRVLKPGGIFAAVLVGPRTPDTLVGEFYQLVGKFLKEEYPNIAGVKTGDERVKSPEGLLQLFSPEKGFSGEVAVVDFELCVNSTLDGVWEFFKDTYLIGMLPEEGKAKLRGEINRLLEGKCDREGRVALKYPMRKIQVERV